MKTLYFFLFLCFIQPDVNAQWLSAQGPYGGYVYQLKANDTYIYASKLSGIYRSDDSGQIWEKCDSTGYFGRIALDGKSLLVNYNLNNLSHLRFSPDNGDHWINVPLPSGTPYLDNFAVKSNIILFSYQNLLWQSVDFGQHWESYALAGETVHYYQLLGTFEGRTYLGNRTRLFSSEDGLNWTFLSNVPGSNQNNIQNLYRKGDIMISLVGKTIGRSLDAGLQWEIGATEDNNNLGANTEFSSENGVFYASTGKPMFHSTDNGLSWTYIDPNGPKIYYHTSQNNIILGHLFGLGVLRSTDLGQSFEPSNHGLDGGDVMTLSVQNNDLWIWDEQGITRQNTNQLQWDAPSIYPLPTYFGAYVSIFHFKNAVFVRKDHGDLLRSLDSGQSWTTVTPAQSIVTSDFITFNQKGDSLLISSEFFNTYLSTDFGDHWTLINPHIDSQIGSVMKAMTIQGPNAFVSNKINLYQSKDNLQTWNKIGNDSPFGTGLLHLKLFSTPRFLFAFVNLDQVFRSADAGETWLPISIPLPNPFTTSSEHEVVFAEIGAVLVAFFEQGGIFISYNDGISWELFTEGIPFETSVTAFGYNETSLWAGTYYWGVYQRSLNDLVPVSTVQPSRNKATLILSPNPTLGTFSCTLPTEISGEATLSIFDLQGKKMLCRTESAEQLKNVDLSNFSSGIYVVSISTAQGIFVGKVVLNG